MTKYRCDFGHRELWLKPHGSFIPQQNAEKKPVEMIYQNKNLKKKVPSPCSLSDRQEEGVPGPHTALEPSFTGNGEGTTTTERTLRLMSASLRLLLWRGSPRCTAVVRISYRPRDGSATGRLGRGGLQNGLPDAVQFTGVHRGPRWP